KGLGSGRGKGTNRYGRAPGRRLGSPRRGPYSDRMRWMLAASLVFSVACSRSHLDGAEDAAALVDASTPPDSTRCTCATDADCPVGTECRFGCACMPAAECEADADCDADERCEEGACVARRCES